MTFVRGQALAVTRTGVRSHAVTTPIHLTKRMEMTTNDPRLTFTMHRRAFLTTAGATLALTATGSWDRQAAAAADAVTAPGATTAPSAAPTFPPTQTELRLLTPEELQTFLDYDPASDPNAAYMRSQVARARRIDLPAATQANPRLSPRPEVFSLDTFYWPVVADAPSFRQTRYGFDQYPYISRFAQYVDYMGDWLGLSGRLDTIPNPARVDVAHRNGALALGTVFQPYFSATPGAVTDFIAKDAEGHFVVGDKLVDLAHHFGYDGYFLNIEGTRLTRAQADDLAAMFDAMHDRARKKGMPDFYLQIYDALLRDGSAKYRNRFTEDNAGWIDPGRVVDSMFINYAWPQKFAEPDWAHDADYVAPSVALAKSRGLDPFETLFFALDMGEENDGKHANALDYYADQVVPLNGERPPVASLALYSQSDRVVRRTQAQVGAQATDPLVMQEAIHVADRKFWAGRAENPAVLPAPVHPSVEEAVSPDWVPQYGVANFIPERSVIAELPFTTRFNTGQGHRFFLRGASAHQRVWYSMGVQDVLPTWQWWTRDLDGATGVPGLLRVDYDHTVAFDGGSSLRLDGPVGDGAGTEVRLFKTAIDADRPAVMSLIVHDGSVDASGLVRLGVSYDDAPGRTTWLTARSRRAVANGWRRLEFRVAPRRGTLVTAVSVGVVAPSGVSVDDYRVYIGELRIAAPRTAQTPPPPAGLRIDTSAPSSGGSGLTAGLRWRSTPEIWYYDLRTITTSPRWLGRVSGDAYVLDDVEPGTRVAVVAVAPDGTESNPAVVTIR
ncbi:MULTISPECIES: endo-beta-N-acetylglucosaminidase [unclassified Isoptericola]|uniref:endo-beta-N-acetylglucosaminidase n=1 Tax=unclassified Isoptericola TaxID=2623355 RepID=UPI003651367C